MKPTRSCCISYLSSIGKDDDLTSAGRFRGPTVFPLLASFDLQHKSSKSTTPPPLEKKVVHNGQKMMLFIRK